MAVMSSDPVNHNGAATVYVVDDDRGIRESLRELIMSMGLRVECFETGERFLQTYQPHSAGCLILDMRMPGMNGIEVQESLIDTGYRLPVIIITGHGDIASCVRAVKHGAVDFLEKPYRPQVLRECIRKALEIDQQQREESELDAQSTTVYAV